MTSQCNQVDHCHEMCLYLSITPHTTLNTIVIHEVIDLVVSSLHTVLGMLFVKAKLSYIIYS